MRDDGQQDERGVWRHGDAPGVAPTRECDAVLK